MNTLPIKIGIAAAIATALIWIVCSIAVYLFPESSMLISGQMVHANLESIDWTLTWSGFFIGLISWVIFVGISVWLVAVIYGILTRAKSSTKT
ncbi:MAG: DUF5676 family membrane protein [Thiohalomonadales bacterium]